MSICNIGVFAQFRIPLQGQNEMAHECRDQSMNCL